MQKLSLCKEKAGRTEGGKGDTGFPHFAENGWKVLKDKEKFAVEKAVENVYNFS